MSDRMLNCPWGCKPVPCGYCAPGTALTLFQCVHVHPMTAEEWNKRPSHERAIGKIHTKLNRARKSLAILGEWKQAEKARRDAVAAYNVRHDEMEKARELGDWTINVDAEFRAIHEAQEAASKIGKELYEALVSGPELQGVA